MFGAHSVRGTGAALVVLASLVVASPSLASGGHGQREIRVSGQQYVTGDPPVYTSDGSLNGVWTFPEFDYTYDAETGWSVAWGTEVFTGCLDKRRDGTCSANDPTGTLNLRFVAWTHFDPLTGALITGQCVHPITGGDGAFAHASGVIRMRDTPRPDGSFVTHYRGTLTLR